jgi:hypothetical protein
MPIWLKKNTTRKMFAEMNFMIASAQMVTPGWIAIIATIAKIAGIETPNLAGDSLTQESKLLRGLNVEDPGVPWAEC